MYNTAPPLYLFNALNTALSAYSKVPNGAPFQLNISDFVTPTDNERARWLSVKESIKPHLLGQMPARILQAFPNEDVNQRRYRTEVYCSCSQPLLSQAIDNVYKIVQSDDFIVSFDERVGDILKRVSLGGQRLEGANLQKQVLGVLYKARILDPNGYFGIVGKRSPITGELLIEIEIYPSENIVIRSDNLIVFALPNGTSVGNSIWRAYTPNIIIDINKEGNIVSEPLRYSGEGGLACAQFGGRNAIDEEGDNKFKSSQYNTQGQTLVQGSTSIIEYQQSDFGFAVSQLDALEIANSEKDIVTYLHAHPIKIMLDIPCDACGGTGQRAELDVDGYPLYTDVMRNGVSISQPVMHTCETCKGKKSLSIGAQDVITIPNAAPINIGEARQPLSSLKDNIVAYVTPDINSAKFLQDTVAAAKNECKEMLNLHRLEDFSQSGVSKSIDKEAGFTRLRAIGEGIGNMFERLLKIVVYVDSNDITPMSLKRRWELINSIRVQMPSYFDMRTTEEAEQAYNENLLNKDHSQRYNERLNLMKKANATPAEIATFKIAYDYTDGLNLATKAEILDLMGAGLIAEQEAYAAMNIGALLARVKRAYVARTGTPLDLSGIADYAPIRALLDAELSLYEDRRTARTAMPAMPRFPETPISE